MAERSKTRREANVNRNDLTLCGLLSGQLSACSAIRNLTRYRTLSFSPMLKAPRKDTAEAPPGL